MKKNTRQNIQKKAEIKNEVEHLSNKSLIIFTVALICEIVLLFLYSAFQGVGSYISKLQTFVTTVSIIGLILFAAMILISVILKKKKGASALTSGLMSWSFVALAVSVCSFVIYPIDIVTGLFTAIGLANKGGVLALKLSSIMGSKAILVIMLALIVYVIAMFVYYGIKMKKVKNSK